MAAYLLKSNRALLLLLSSLAVVVVASYGSIGGSSESILDVLKTDERLVKAKEWAERSSLMDTLDFGSYAGPNGKLTLIVPSNKALGDYEIEEPERANFLLNDEESLETLMLFASTDYEISPSDIFAGALQKEDSILTLLSEFAGISKQGRICISWGRRCAKIVVFDIAADDGRIYIINEVLLPDEILDIFEEKGI